MTLPDSPSFHPAQKAFVRRALVALILVLFLGATACGDESVEPGTSSTTTSAADAPEGQTYTQADTGKEAPVAVGEEVLVSLETCGGCGYQWRITQEPDAAIVESLGSTNEPRPTTTQPGDQPLVGVPTDENFRFRGVAAGRTDVTIGYFPPAGEAPEESFTLVFVVA